MPVLGFELCQCEVMAFLHRQLSGFELSQRQVMIFLQRQIVGLEPHDLTAVRFQCRGVRFQPPSA